MKIDALSELMPTDGRFPRPDWQSIEQALDDVADDAVHEAWCEVGRVWLRQVAQACGPDYSVFETENFLILNCLDDRPSASIGAFMERSRAGVLSMLDGIGLDGGAGKNVVLLFGNDELYYDYIAYFYSEGEHPMSSGVFISHYYSHMAIPHFDMYETEATFAHEFTHRCLSHLPIPLWLNEGLAVTLEDELCGSRPIRMDSKQLERHKQFWDAQTIQEFWNGLSFGRIDEGNELSYELARFCIKALAQDAHRFTGFANNSTYEDGGEAAAFAFFEGSLGGLPYQFFGDGDWSPKPDEWSSAEAESDQSVHRSGSTGRDARDDG
ncbi:MAG: hypothetical protein AAF465_04210 [Pseudomonadota bacterium]